MKSLIFGKLRKIYRKRWNEIWDKGPERQSGQKVVRVTITYAEATVECMNNSLLSYRNFGGPCNLPKFVCEIHLFAELRTPLMMLFPKFQIPMNVAEKFGIYLDKTICQYVLHVLQEYFWRNVFQRSNYQIFCVKNTPNYFISR